MHARQIYAGLLAVIFLCAGLIILYALPRVLSSRGNGNSQRVISKTKSFPVTVEDVFKQPVTIQHKPERIISLAPNVTETLFAIGTGDRLIADTTYCDYPLAAAKLPKIGGYLDPNVEKIAVLKPDLVLAARGTRRDLLDQLRALKLTMVTVDANTLTEVTGMIRLIGRVVGSDVAAEKLAGGFEARTAIIVGKTKDLPAARRPRTLFLFTLDDLFTVGPGSHVDELIRQAGGVNIAAGTKTPWPQMNMEAVVAADPQVILVLAGHGSKMPLTSQKALVALRAKPRWRTVSAVKTGRVIVVDDDEATLPGPRLINGLEAFARALHPDLFPAGGAK